MVLISTPQEDTGEIEELKKMRNRDMTEISHLKVELSKLQTVLKRYQDSGAMIQNAK